MPANIRKPEESTLFMKLKVFNTTIRSIRTLENQKKIQTTTEKNRKKPRNKYVCVLSEG